VPCSLQAFMIELVEWTGAKVGSMGLASHMAKASTTERATAASIVAAMWEN